MATSYGTEPRPDLTPTLEGRKVVFSREQPAAKPEQPKGAEAKTADKPDAQQVEAKAAERQSKS